ncbi:MAG: hypothetical protein ACQCXQ_08470 [Verrucomicrobiales bacterium]|nr:hypothetical protein [Verrucomicrobiota bacterium JB025]
MKLETTLPERPGLLHAVPVMDLFAALWLTVLLGPLLLQRSGVAVELAPSRFQLERFQDALVVTIGPGEEAPRIHLGRDSVTMEELGERLDKLADDGAASNALVLLKTDKGTPVGIERAVMELVVGKGFRAALMGETAPAGGETGTEGE